MPDVLGGGGGKGSLGDPGERGLLGESPSDELPPVRVKGLMLGLRGLIEGNVHDVHSAVQDMVYITCINQNDYKIYDYKEVLHLNINIKVNCDSENTGKHAIC